jgi:hypothetical protein
MNIEDKPREKSNLIMNFGILIQPLEELAQRKSAPEIMEYKYTYAKVGAGIKDFSEQVKYFVTFGEMWYQTEYYKIQSRLNVLNNTNLNNKEKRTNIELEQLHRKFKNNLETLKSYIIDQIDQVPIDWNSKLYEANTPFTTHMRILEVISSARNRIDYIDRYLRPDFFYLYLAYLDKNIKIRLVTTEGKYTIKDDFGVKGVEHVSKLFSQEFSNYQLIEFDQNDYHDRNLRIDDNIFFLGTGTDKAGKYPTNFGLIDSTPKEHQDLDDFISKGKIIPQIP